MTMAVEARFPHRRNQGGADDLVRVALIPRHPGPVVVAPAHLAPGVEVALMAIGAERLGPQTGARDGSAARDRDGLSVHHVRDEEMIRALVGGMAGPTVEGT